jgi:hypothetical protein
MPAGSGERIGGGSAQPKSKTPCVGPPCTQTFQLLSVEAFEPGGHKGQEMEARGPLYKGTNYARLNRTSLQTVGASCQNRP